MKRFTPCSLVLLASAVLVALTSAPAYAVDGVILINQNTSVNGIPGCARTGLPIVICQSGSYRLTGNLTVPDANTDGIDINADNVTLDLNGFTISGPVTCTPRTYPVQCSATGTGSGVLSDGTHKNVTVRNGTVQGMGNAGIRVFAIGALVEDVHADSNAGIFTAGIEVGDGIVTHCTATTNAGAGIEAFNASFNHATFNGGNGILGLSLVSNNTVGFNGQAGIAAALLASYNLIVGNIGFGIIGDIGNFGVGMPSGYVGNVLAGNGGTVSNATSLGHNLCNGSAC